MPESASYKGRLLTLGIICVALITVLVFRLWSLQIIQTEVYQSKAEDNLRRISTTTASRGRIFDRNGKPLVTNKSTMAVLAPALSVKDFDELKQLAAAEEEKLSEEQKAAGKTGIWMKRLDWVNRLSEVLYSTENSLTPTNVVKKLTTTREGPLDLRLLAVDVSMETVSYLTEHNNIFPGVEIEARAVREYPEGSHAAHVLGYTGEISDADLNTAAFEDYAPSDIVGKAGAERAFEHVLQGVRGTRLWEVNASGLKKRIVEETLPSAGQDIYLTIDIDIQKVAEKALDDACKAAQRDGKKNAKAGAAVVLDVTNGEVIAMANVPTYFPKEFIGGIPEKRWEELRSKESNNPLMNRAMMSMYPPASTFKTFVAMGVLNDGLWGSGRTFECKGQWIGLGKPWPRHCWNRVGHGEKSMIGAIRESCDVYFYEAGKRFYERDEEELQAYVRSYGYGESTGIDLPGEASGRVPDAQWKKRWNEDYPEYQKWLPGDTVSLSIGQGDLLATPLQVANSHAAIANNGKMYKPHVLLSIRDSMGNTIREAEPELSEIQPKTSKSSLSTIQRALREVIAEGTGRSAFRNFGVEVAGKTGTAEMGRKDPLTGKRDQDDYAWFVGYAPARKPKYVVAIMIEQGGSGGAIAGPAARQIFAKLFDQKVELINATDNSR